MLNKIRKFIGTQITKRKYGMTNDDIELLNHINEADEWYEKFRKEITGDNTNENI